MFGICDKYFDASLSEILVSLSVMAHKIYVIHGLLLGPRSPQFSVPGVRVCSEGKRGEKNGKTDSQDQRAKRPWQEPGRGGEGSPHFQGMLSRKSCKVLLFTGELQMKRKR